MSDIGTSTHQHFLWLELTKSHSNCKANGGGGMEIAQSIHGWGIHPTQDSSPTELIGLVGSVGSVRSDPRLRFYKILSSGYRFSLGRSKKESHFAAIRFVFLGKEQLHLMILKKHTLGFCK